MSFFTRFFKKEKEIPRATQQEETTVALEKVNFAKLSKPDRQKYVEEQCELIVECNNNVDAAKSEYKSVGQYFSDIQVIEGQPAAVRDNITYIAKKITELNVDRKIMYSEEKKISNTRFVQLSKEEDHIVDAIKDIKNNEIYLQVIKKDNSSLIGEKEALRMDTRELMTRQSIIRNVSIVSMICFGIIVIAFLVAGLTVTNNNSMAFYWILFIAALFAAGDIVLYQRTVYNIILTEKKINRAIALHNKVKIKLINITNLLSYQYAKYGVKSSYELSDLYQRYLETKAIREKFRQATLELSDAEDELLGVLNTLGLYDTNIWLSQVKALSDPKEMVELRHDYSIRRQKLRRIIEDNSNQAEDSKAQLRDILVMYPMYANEILAIVDKYD